MALTMTYGATVTDITSWSTTIGTLANTSASTASTGVTNTTPAVSIECKITGTATTSTGTADLYLVESIDDTDYSTGSADTDNVRYIGSVQLNTNTAVTKVITVGNLPNYWKLRVINNSGGAFTAASFAYQTISYTG